VLLERGLCCHRKPTLLRSNANKDNQTKGIWRDGFTRNQRFPPRHAMEPMACPVYVAAPIVAISSIHLLKAFMNA